MRSANYMLWYQLNSHFNKTVNSLTAISATQCVYWRRIDHYYILFYCPGKNYPGRTGGILFQTKKNLIFSIIFRKYIQILSTIVHNICFESRPVPIETESFGLSDYQWFTKANERRKHHFDFARNIWQKSAKPATKHQGKTIRLPKWSGVASFPSMND